MSALPIPQTYDADRLDWSMLVSTDDAARLLGVTRGHLRRLCGSELQRKAMAFYAVPPGGGNPRWFIDRRYDPRLTPSAPLTAGQAPDLSKYAQRQRDVAGMRVACVLAFRDANQTRPGLQKDWLPQLVAELRRKFNALKISRSQLLHWHKVYTSPGDIEALIDKRGGDQKSQGDPAAWAAFKDFYLSERTPKVRRAWRYVKDLAAAENLSWCSYQSCLRQLDSRIPREVQLRNREPRRWRREMEPGIAQATEAWSAGCLWVGDWKQCDAWVMFGGQLVRPWFCCWLDWRSRKIVGWTLSPTPNATGILAALRSGLMDESNFGGPDEVKIDNGRDFDAYMFHSQTKKQRLTKVKIGIDEDQIGGVFNLIGVRVGHSIPHSPNGKSRAERVFGCLDALFESLPTYTGRKTDEKPEYLNDLLRNKRRVIPKFEHLQSRIADFVKGLNERTDHAIDDLVDRETGERLSPAQAFERWCPRRRMMADPQVLDLLLAHWHKPVSVGREGIPVAIAGKTIKYGAFEPALMPYRALDKKHRPKLRIAYDPHDLREIKVYDQDFRFICAASSNKLGGGSAFNPVTREHLQEVMREKARYRRLAKYRQKNPLMEWLTPEELAAHKANKEARQAAQPDVPIKVIDTPLDGQADKVKRAAKPMKDRQPLPSLQELLSPSPSRKAKPMTFLNLQDFAPGGGTTIWDKLGDTLCDGPLQSTPNDGLTDDDEDWADDDLLQRMSGPKNDDQSGEGARHAS